MDFERLGMFYLGRRYDVDSKTTTGELVLYDSKDLVTHALTVGMTGSGKTGLGIALVEEAAIDGVPVIVIDPKGDLTNLLLTFPDLVGADFGPWVAADEVERAGVSRAEFAAAQAARWKTGLAEWGQDGARIRRLREAADFTIYTPGSTAGRTVSMLGSFAPPQSDDAELVGERVQVTVSGLLALTGLTSADPLKSPEHILLSAILTAAWAARQTPDLASLVHAVQQPPVSRIGVMDVDAFFPPKERFALAMSMNALMASPAFKVWSQGDPLDVSAFLRTPAGKPRVSIFSIAHLDDTQRMFFVAQLLTALTGWMRAQSGTSSLRALVYMDEIFGYFPPVASPPSKAPLLRLLKQGRAVGLGVALATQNPADLDYKGLANIGTWWLGRLQTERDKSRLLDGLEGAQGSGSFDRGEVDRLLSALTSRVFVMRNVHEDGLTVFQSRWALSFLRGPLSRDEIGTLMAEKRQAEQPAGPEVASSAGSVEPDRSGNGGERPAIPPGVPQFFAPTPSSSGSSLEPVLYGAAGVAYVDRKLKVDVSRVVARAASIADAAVPVDWDSSSPVDLSPDDLVTMPQAGWTFRPLPGAASNPKHYGPWTRQFATWIAANEALELLRSATTGEVSRAGESERDFRARLQQSAREARDQAVEQLRRKYAPKQAALEERLRRARQAVARETEQASGQAVQTAISMGATLVGALLGRKAASAATLGRATTAVRGVGRSMKESRDIERAKETVSSVEAAQRQLEDDIARETSDLEERRAAAGEQLDRITLRPKKGDVTVKVVALVWMPR
jgi:hypothetical protein